MKGGLKAERVAKGTIPLPLLPAEQFVDSVIDKEELRMVTASNEAGCLGS